MPRLVSGLEQVFTNLGIVGSGYKLFFFEYNTTTPKTTYSDQDLTIPNPNPVECDSAGRPDYDIWGADPAQYKCVLGTPDSVIGNINPIVTLDPIDNLNTGSIINLDPLPAAYWGTTSGTSTAYTLTALVPITSYSDKQCFFLDFNTTCGASPTININNIGTINLKKYTGSGTKIALEAGDVTTQRFIAINDGVDIVILNPQIPYLTSTRMSKATSTAVGVSLVRQRITIANNGSTPKTTINLGAGNFIFSDASGQGVISALQKSVAATWVAGNGGGLDTGSVANNTWYYIYGITNVTNPDSPVSDIIFSTSNSAPTLPTNYTKYSSPLGAFKTNSSAQILPGTWCLDGTFIFTSAQLIVSSTAGNATVNGVMPSLACEGRCPMSLSTTGGGYSDFSLTGNLQTATNNTYVSTIGTNNAFATNGTGTVYSDNGSVAYSNSSTAGGVANQTARIMAYKLLNL